MKEYRADEVARQVIARHHAAWFLRSLLDFVISCPIDDAYDTSCNLPLGAIVKRMLIRRRSVAVLTAEGNE